MPRFASPKCYVTDKEVDSRVSGQSLAATQVVLVRSVLLGTLQTIGAASKYKYKFWDKLW